MHIPLLKDGILLFPEVKKYIVSVPEKQVYCGRETGFDKIAKNIPLHLRIIRYLTREIKGSMSINGEKGRSFC